MDLLALDTSQEKLSVCLYKKGRLAEMASEHRPIRHSSSLLPLIQCLMKTARQRPQDLDLIAVGVGPGSFTGLRVGVMTAKMLSYVWGKKIVGVSSLEAIMRCCAGNADGIYAVATDARKNQIYGAAYELKNGLANTLIAPLLTGPEVFGGRLPKGCVLFGIGGSSTESSMERLSQGVAEAAMPLARKNGFVSAVQLEPFYLHPKDCNVTLVKK